MSSRDVSDTLDDALRFTGLDEVKVNHKPRLLSDNGPCYISGELADYLEEHGMTHTHIIYPENWRNICNALSAIITMSVIMNRSVI